MSHGFRESWLQELGRLGCFGIQVILGFLESLRSGPGGVLADHCEQ
jgi:hypothetical protein